MRSVVFTHLTSGSRNTCPDMEHIHSNGYPFVFFYGFHNAYMGKNVFKNEKMMEFSLVVPRLLEQRNNDYCSCEG